MKKIWKIIVVLLLLLALVFVVYTKYYKNNDKTRDNVGNQIYCTADVKQCSDGTYVSRDAGNNCEFKACGV